jgi:predicted phosphodiesterase
VGRTSIRVAIRLHYATLALISACSEVFSGLPHVSQVNNLCGANCLYGSKMCLKTILPVLFWVTFMLPTTCAAQVTIAQISDTHIGEKRAPQAADNLRKAVEMINARHVDAVILTGDMGENPQYRKQAKEILKSLKAPLYYVPGNHDVHTQDVTEYRAEFGKDYYRFRVKSVEFVVIDSQLLGNYDKYEAASPPPLPRDTSAQSEEMLAWLAQQPNPAGRIMIGAQHIPAARDDGFPPDSKPYWVISEPYLSRELDLLHKLGIKHMLVGHWHNARVFLAKGVTWHVAPATSWLPWGGALGFALHRISPNGDVNTEFIALPNTRP